ncbi:MULTISPECIES: hypothetical protein [unclassified Cellulophaga]|uniref:hypothetical protein n=1 Tax=unclassified Cellulophaga TaxID=2634405 RepID=UPI0026E3E9C5|nr:MULTISPECIES: hypothetical protein [unclassified Cellulophaga]MDO6492409.1 hypothetical protein [Cellulophaga sp. 2_MG-2023]MDO6496091.1 hypothetical protein [Cellulophaga sp. 3_MG-2023]
MKKYIIILLLIVTSCKGESKKDNKTKEVKSEVIKTSYFELVKAKKQNGLLILFPCFPCNAENTLSEFKIAELSVKNNYSVLAMNLNQRLYLNKKEKQELADQLARIIKEHGLSKKNIFIGGFSSGGNVSLLISNYLVIHKSQIKPKGVFIVDSPIDLLGLYTTAEKNLKLNFSVSSVQESTWIKNMFDEEFGNPSTDQITKYEQYSPYTFKTENINNLKGLKNLKVRLYTEPDVEWWKEYAKNEYEDLNAFYIQKLSEKLMIEFGEDTIELIKTKNRGYRANGERHPHSWAIVNKKDLINWMLE